MKTKRLKERLECMLFKSTFWERYTVLHKVNFKIDDKKGASLY